MKTPVIGCVHKQVHIAIDLTINSCGKFEFIKFTVQTLNAQLSEVHRSTESTECLVHHLQKHATS